MLRTSLSEAPLGFPALLEAIKLYDTIRDNAISEQLITKSHPAYTAAEIVRTETHKRREAEFEARKSKALLEYYESSVREAEDLRKKNSQHIDEKLKLEHRISTLADEVIILRRQSETLESTKNELSMINDALTHKNTELTSKLEALSAENALLRKSITEAPLGFPSLLEAIKLYDAKHDALITQYFERKSHPAYNAAETIRTETQKRLEAEFESRKAKLLLDYYFSISPDAQEDNETVIDQIAKPTEIPPEDKDEDLVIRYLSREEYDKLSITERNQLALDRFWHWNKSKRSIGRLYEQYIGWLYERDGWIVDYFGISEGFSDLGRDLLCHKDMTTLIIQCKNWSKSKRIYEKHIFQLFGTAYEYREKNKHFEEVRPVFYTSTQLSDLARSFAKEFRIELHEGFVLKRFPVIKCNIGREGERIYHLPFDQQYYTTKINPKDGDCYCATVAEAEAMGFRRAYRWHGDRDDF